jgi:GNAT superfamily N-acetyltransferase
VGEHQPRRGHPGVRDICPADVPVLSTMIYELADYERQPADCHVTPEQLHAALFGAAPALFGLIAEQNGEPVGYALWFLNFSTWEGVHGVYLEDLYVRPSARGAGLGKALLTRLIDLAAERGYARVEWSVLDWNEPSIAFYRSLGAVPMDGWTVYRLTMPTAPHPSSD